MTSGGTLDIGDWLRGLGLGQFETAFRENEIDDAVMIDGVVGNTPLPASIRQDIIERTDGIPLFVEEMTKAVLEAESASDAHRIAAAIPAHAPVVPATCRHH